jgi:hypothetical protein
VELTTLPCKPRSVPVTLLQLIGEKTMNNAPPVMYRVGRRARSGEWRPATKHRKYDDAEIVARGLVLGEEATACRIWKVGERAPQLVARVGAVPPIGAVVSRVE